MKTGNKKILIISFLLGKLPMLFVGSHVQVMCLTFTLMVKFYLTGIDFFQVELFHILLFYSIFKFSDKIVKSSVKKSKTIQLEHCNCRRTLVNIEESEINSVPFSNTTCGWDAFQRGTNQRIAGFSFYGNSSSSVHKARKYFGGIEENLRLVRSHYGPDWSMRLYYDLETTEGDIVRLSSHWSRSIKSVLSLVEMAFMNVKDL